MSENPMLHEAVEALKALDDSHVEILTRVLEAIPDMISALQSARLHLVSASRLPIHPEIRLGFQEQADEILALLCRLAGEGGAQ